MTQAVKDYCISTDQKVPGNIGELVAVIYYSLAECYAATVKELEKITKRTYSKIHIIGGGSKDNYLNVLTAKMTGKEVHAGPAEATALGNVMAQALKAGEFKSVKEVRSAVHKSFNVKIIK